jgi:hypothetical protein
MALEVPKRAIEVFIVCRPRQNPALRAAIEMEQKTSSDVTGGLDCIGL